LITIDPRYFFLPCLHFYIYFHRQLVSLPACITFLSIYLFGPVTLRQEN
jgi:hypothetical protein